MKTKILPFILFSVLLFQFKAKAQNADSVAVKIQQIESKILPMTSVAGDKPMTIAERMAFYKVKGMSIAVVHNYKVEWAKGYGFANDNLKIPVDVHTLFQAGSISKTINSVGVLKLGQDKNIALYGCINN